MEKEKKNGQKLTATQLEKDKDGREGKGWVFSSSRGDL